MNRRHALCLIAVAPLAACSSPGVEQFRAERPVLDLRDYFNGTVDAWGIVRDRGGTISQRFTVRIEGRWEGDKGTLDEAFTYSDGRTQRRVWTLHRSGDRYVGTAADVIGQAQGEAAGNAFRLRYVLDYPWGDSTVHLDVDDWMYLVDPEVLLNRSTVSKLGVEIAQVFISFRKARSGEGSS